MNVRRIALSAIASWAVTSAAATALPQHEPSGSSVATALQNCSELTIFDHVRARVVEDGAVVLSGKVTSGAKKLEVERHVSRIAGVREIRSEISVLPASREDDDLRYRVSRAIYGHPTFWSYAAMRRPPIHIIVEEGTVTLAGTVNSQVERAMAGSLASDRGQRPVINQLEAQPLNRAR